MAIPTRDDILGLPYSNDGSPWCRIASKSGVDLDTLEYSFDGSPWWGIKSTVSVSWKLYVGATQITTMYVGNTEVTTAYLNETALKS
jgi:hypothetical protein